MLIIAQNLKTLRNEQNLTQEQVADVIGVKRNVYGRYENDTRTIPIELLIKLADFYNVSLDYLVGREI